MDAAEQLKQMRAGRRQNDVPLESVLTTEDLARREGRAPDYQAENQALLTLAQTLARAPETLLQTLCDLTLPLCRAQSAGISILEEEGGEPLFRWRAVAGEMAPYLGVITPSDFAPCGITMERDAPQLFSQPGRFYPYAAAIQPPISELLLIPFHLDQKPIGTLWIAGTQEQTAFDQEDVRLLRNLADFAAAGWRVSLAQETSHRASRALDTAAEARGQQARLFDTVLSSIVDFVYTFDREGRITYANQALLDLWQQDLDTACGKNFFELNYPPDLAARLQGQIETVFTGGTMLKDETLLTLGAGATRAYEYIFVPIFGRDGAVEVVAGSTRDITQRYVLEEAHKQAESRLREHVKEIAALNARLKRAMAETHHRVKNNLQMISAMIEMQMQEHRVEKTVPLEEYAQLKTHIYTLSIVHDMLTKSVKETEDDQRVSTQEVLDQLLPMLHQTAWNREVRFTVEEALLTAKQCVALALVLNELVTNAIKHGHQEAEVSFRVDGNKAILDVSDDGPGFPAGFDPLQAANMGLELVESLVRTDLKGSSSYTTQTQGGGRVTVTFPLPPVKS